MLIVSIIRFILILLTGYIALFTLWRSFEREHVDDISNALDRIIIAMLIAAYLARIPDLVDLFLKHNITLFSVLNPLVGMSLWQVAITLFCISFYILCRDNWRDRYALLDFLVVSVALFLSGFMVWQTGTAVVGALLAGTLPSIPMLIVTGVGIVYFFGVSRLLAYFERQYRAYFWYRYRRSSAQTGFVTSVFFILTGLFGVIWELPQLPFAVISLSTFTLVWSLLMCVGGFVLLYIRSGRLKKR